MLIHDKPFVHYCFSESYRLPGAKPECCAYNLLGHLHRTFGVGAPTRALTVTSPGASLSLSLAPLPPGACPWGQRHPKPQAYVQRRAVAAQRDS